MIQRKTGVGQISALAELKIRADRGDVGAQTEYGKAMSDAAQGEPEIALKYFRMAAEQGDPVGSYLYAALADRMGEKGEDILFRMQYAAAMGVAESYVCAANAELSAGHSAMARTLLHLAADSDIDEAKFRLYDIYKEENPSLAKGYLQRVRGFSVRKNLLLLGLGKVEATAPGEADGARMLGFSRSVFEKAAEIGKYRECYLLCERLGRFGNTEMKCLLCRMTAEGIGTEKDPQRALQGLLSLLKEGKGEAGLMLCDLYLEGVLPSEDPQDEAIRYADMAADLGVAAAFDRLGDLYADAQSPKCNLGYAVRMYEQGAKLGDPEASRKELMLKQKRESMFRAGQEESGEESFRRFALAAAMGYAPAEVALGKCYELGVGTRPDRHRAFLWYNRAAGSGEPSAWLPLGICYTRGVGVNRDFRHGMKNLRLAQKGTSGDAAAAEAEIRRLLENRRRKMVRRMFAAAMELAHGKKYEKATELALAASSMGDADATYLLACMCEFGLGLPSDRNRADVFYRRAAELGFTDTRGRIKDKILHCIR